MTFPRPTALLACVALVLAACGAKESTASGGDRPFEESPLPTIGLGSDVGSISGSADIRAIDAERVDSIVMIGDSITVGSVGMLEDQFTLMGFENVTINAKTGKRIGVSFGDNPSGADVAQFIAGAQPGEAAETLWVIALGTNDIGQYSDPDEIEAEIDEVLEPIPDDAPLVWVNTYYEDRAESTDEVNAAIEARLTDRGNATISRWYDIAPLDGVLRGDGIHPGDDGAKVFAELVTTTVADFLQ